MRSSIGNSLRQRIKRTNELINFDFESDMNNIFIIGIEPYLSTNDRVYLPIEDIKALYQLNGYNKYVSIKEFYLYTYSKICLLMTLEGYLPDTFTPCKGRWEVLDYISYQKQPENISLFEEIVGYADDLYLSKITYLILKSFEVKKNRKDHPFYTDTIFSLDLPFDEIIYIRANRFPNDEKLFLNLTVCKIISNFINDDILLSDIQGTMEYPPIANYNIVLYSDLTRKTTHLSIYDENDNGRKYKDVLVK